VVKEITGLQQNSTEPLVGLAQRLHDGDVHKLADHINIFFQQVAPDLRPLSDPTTLSTTSVVLSEFVIDQSAVERKLSQISVYKAPGPDDLPNWILRDFCSQLSGLVFAIFSALIRESTVPARWKYANVIPAPKANPLQRIETDLRLISLTATLSKLLASFVGVWILNRIEDKLDTRQYRALKGRSTRLPRTLCMVDIMHHWYKAIDEGQSVRSVFIDFAKAFDHVDHNVLVDFALPDSTIRRISSLLCHRRQRVKIWRRDV